MKLERRSFLVGLASVCLARCGSSSRRDQARALTWGSPGRRNGQFIKPRAISAHDGETYVIDTTGRVQVFTEDGAFVRLWSVPESENGTPTSVAFDCEGRVLIPDTHYSRLLRYTRQGELLGQWGEFGPGPQQFVYPTDVAAGGDGTLYISEYGTDAERVHVTDAQGGFLRQWGTFGEGPGQFNRAMAIEMGPDGSLYVVDTGNDRLQRFDTQGNLLGIIGKPGVEPGCLKAPFGLAIAADGAVLICEYGTCRISRFSPHGAFIATIGEPGREIGQFDDPRGVAVSASGNLFVADTGNHRIQRFSMGDLG